jgi:hypothetical protein
MQRIILAHQLLHTSSTQHLKALADTPLRRQDSPLRDLTEKIPRRRKFVVRENCGHAWCIFNDFTHTPMAWDGVGGGRLGSTESLFELFEKAGEFEERAKRASISAGGHYIKHNTCTRPKPAPSRRSTSSSGASSTRPTLDRHFSSSSGTVATRRVGGFGALCNCASHYGCRLRETTLRERSNAKPLKTREIRGQRGP